MKLTIENHHKVAGFEFFRGNHGWVLVTIRKGQDSNGRPKNHPKETYYGDLRGIFKAIIDITAGECKDIQELKTLLECQSASDIEKWLIRAGIELTKEYGEGLNGKP